MEENHREILEIKKVNCKPTNYYKCSLPTCNAKTTHEFCRHHSVKYNQCGYEGCQRRCRKEYCSWHNPIELARKRERSARDRQRVRDAKNQAVAHNQ